MRIRLLLIALAAVALSGCTVFEVRAVMPDGQPALIVRETGAPLISRTAGIKVKHEWLDAATNTLHEFSVQRDVDENADAQLQMMQMLTQALLASQGVPVAAPDAVADP